MEKTAKVATIKPNTQDSEYAFLQKLTKDLAKAAITLSKNEVRFLVDYYYQIQEYRKTAASQVLALSESGEPNELVKFLFENSAALETQIKRALDKYTANNAIGIWAREITGIGPVFAAGLIAHIDIEKAPTAGHIWSYAGLNPEQVWEKGKKRPWNASLKTLCWKIGESFVKVSNNPKDVYGKLYQRRKAQEEEKNERLEFKDQAEKKIEMIKKNKVSWGSFQKTVSYIDSYSKGKLSPDHIHSRAKRYAVKMFLSHLHAEMYRDHFHVEPPKPFAIEILGHAHTIELDDLKIRSVK